MPPSKAMSPHFCHGLSSKKHPLGSVAELLLCGQKYLVEEIGFLGDAFGV